MAAHKNYIGGKWVESVTGKTYPVHNPAHTDQVVGEFQTSGVEDTLTAVAAAKEGLVTWTNTPAPARANIIYKALEILGRRAEELAETITIEEGKPIADARGEVKRAMAIMEYAAGEGRRMFGYTTPSELPDTVAYTVRRPLGVVGIITPWNFPLAIPAWKIAPALICGNALVFKPASATPLSAVKLMEIFEEAGLPAGVLNLVTGPGGQVGTALVESPDVKGISFTGSTEIGTELYSESAKRLKKVQAEMGGKNAVIVLSDADMDKAMNGIVQGAFGSTGQRCTATSRVIVEEDVYDRFMTELIERTSKLIIGDGLDASMDIAPLASQNQKDKVLEYIGIGTEEGAELAFGGRNMTGGEFDEGYYVEPAVFTGVTPDMRIAQEEIFGPVLTVFKAKDLKEAIGIANSVEFGLSSSVYTKDITKAYEYINTVETGMVHVNASTLGGEVHLPFGGLNSSGVGQREQGTAAVDFFSEVITVYIDHSPEAS
ncbi:MAG: aldehyde dehydrogenase family protein [Dehalococcoidia bacterium]|jgi:acyl-CoA reductase-like NAD-dependent aldehyde dehydrogenase|nr:aldehyde dehydrogenase family protein [Dehalococcoidia bacterium]HIF42899.1 aldehyde dehydrogenase family protein [Dehalococcoidia bacterium]|tara:strand:+ start:22 stop:1485 length:1464 start_codon:yes stop_codon:yes gene_type:complete